MLTRARSLSILAIILVGLFTALGCSRLPTEPSGVVAPGAAPAVLGESSPEGAPVVEDVQATSVSASRVIFGLTGGTVAAGDFRVVVPPLAITGTATITVTQPDITKPVVELSISPPSANKFRVPVVLVANVAKVDRSLLSVTCLSWYDPSTDTWKPVSGSTVSLLGLTVQAPLMHFSTYRVENNGKAGW